MGEKGNLTTVKAWVDAGLNDDPPHANDFEEGEFDDVTFLNELEDHIPAFEESLESSQYLGSESDQRKRYLDEEALRSKSQGESVHWGTEEYEKFCDDLGSVASFHEEVSEDGEVLYSVDSSLVSEWRKSAEDYNKHFAWLAETWSSPTSPHSIPLAPAPE
mmetsp:Transcript_12721/g.25816  ORF Transcript_12721/g.25816 Transcript_12721/m.25816 type:complete len:161 (-) Transcript_12721:321-803(-)